MSDATFISRVVLSNYRSIAACDVELGPLTFLVGPNGSGKSNFLDALHFVADALRFSLEHAIRARNGPAELCWRGAVEPRSFGMRLDVRMLAGMTAMYAFRVAVGVDGAYRVEQESCLVTPTLGDAPERFVVQDGRAQLTIGPRPYPYEAPPVEADRLYLPSVSGMLYYRPLADRLSRMGFYNFDLARLRQPQPAVAGGMLFGDGSNIAVILRRLAADAPDALARIEEFLGAAVPGVRGVEVQTAEPWDILRLRQVVSDDTGAWTFPAASMSDGTLRALGILVALFHGDRDGRSLVPLVGIEEPEAALHPAALAVLLDALREASLSTQVIVTSHSADLLDDKEIETDQIRAVIAENGETQIGPLDEGGRVTLHDHLYTAGELLRMVPLRPAPRTTNDTGRRQVELFEGMMA